MNDEERTYKNKLTDSYTEEQEAEKDQFLLDVALLQINKGYISKELEDFLVVETIKNPKNRYALNYLFEVYVSRIDTDKAREVAWKLIGIEDCSYFRNYLSNLENPNFIYTQVYLHGDRSKLPPQVLESLEEREFLNGLKDIKNKG